MVNLELELNLNSASDLEIVNHITKMDVYVVITLRGHKTIKKHKEKTAVDRSGGSNPTWNHAVKFPVNEKYALEGRLTLFLQLFSHRVLGDKEIGEVEVPLLDLLRSYTPSTNGNGNGDGMRFVTYPVRTPSETIKGCLSFSYRFNGLSVNSGQAYHQAPPVYGGPPPQQPTRNEERLQTADTFVSAMSLIS